MQRDTRHGARRALELLIENEPAEVKLSILTAYTEAKGDRRKAASALGVNVGVLDEWVARLGLVDMIKERWP